MIIGWKKLLGIIAFLICYLFVYRNLGSFLPILYDDPDYLKVRSQSLFSVSYWYDLVTKPVVNLWHPLSVLTHDVLMGISYKFPYVHHLGNALLHAGNCFLLGKWLRSHYITFFQTLSVCALWGFHPVLIESVSWVSGRKDLLCTFFVLLSLYFGKLCTEDFKDNKFLIVSFLFAILAMLSKPVAVVLPVLLYIQYDTTSVKSLYFPRLYKNKIIKFFPLVIVSILVIFITLFFQSSGGQGIADNRSVLERVSSANWALCYSILVWITPMTHYVGYEDPEKLSWLWLASGFIIYPILIFLIFSNKIAMKLRIGVGVFVLFLMPTLGFFRAGNQLVADRYLYLPSIGLTLLLVFTLSRIKRELLYFCLPVVLWFCFLSYEQRQVWATTRSVFENTLRHKPNHSYALAQVGTLERMEGNNEEAKLYLNKAIQFNSQSPVANIHLGDIAIEEKKLKKAYQHYQIVKNIWSKNAVVYETLTKLAWELGEKGKAREHLSNALALDLNRAELVRLKKLESTLF